MSVLLVDQSTCKGGYTPRRPVAQFHFTDEKTEAWKTAQGHTDISNRCKSNPDKYGTRPGSYCHAMLLVLKLRKEYRTEEARC